MSNQHYDKHTLVQLYIRAQRNDYVHQDFKNYYAGLLAILEQMFEVNFSSPPLPQRALWMLFTETVQSYLSIRTPWSSFLEGSLIVTKIQQLGSQGEKISQLSDQIQEVTRTNQELHLHLLYELFERIYGKHDLVVTWQDLQARGFDVSKEPQIKDYWDEI